ncbi:MAG: hypothetical protein JST92_14210 [Deltaproteobacteria bacterium]|nr:hypothetical protein [Deltaproteobacteria bacterium]
MSPETSAAARPNPWPRRALGSFFRTLCAFVDKHRLGSVVRSKVSPATIKMMDNLPFAFRWVDSTAIDEIEAVLCEVGGPSLCRDLGMELSRSLGGTVVQPVLRAAFFLFGETPESVFGNLDRFFSPTVQGITFVWTPADGRTGLVRATFEGPDCPDGAVHALQGSLQWVFDELLRKPGRVYQAKLIKRDHAATVVDYEVSFGP